MTGPFGSEFSRATGLLSLLGLLACGSGAAVTGSGGGLNIWPAQVSLPPGGNETFVAVMAGALTGGVAWVASGGTITSGGLFTAPTSLGSYEILASYGGQTGRATANVVSAGSPAALYAAASATCAAMPLRATGVTYYFCDCATGADPNCAPNNAAANDANPGTDPSAPKRSWAAVVSRFNAMNAGDTIALCKGGAWTASSVANFLNPRCAAAANMRTGANTTTCDLRDHAPPWGGTARPIIRQTASANLLQFASGTMSGVRILNLDLEGGGGGPGGSGDVGQRAVVTQGTITDFLICNNVINAWFLGIHLLPDGASRIDIWGNRLTMNSLDAYLGSNINGTIDANYIDNNGSNVATAHSIYLQGKAVTNFSFVNNQILRTGAPTVCDGTMLVVHDQYDGLNIENNIIDAGANAAGNCWGMAIANGGYGTAEYYRNLTIRRNLITGFSYAPIYVSEAPGPIIENNVIVKPGSGTGIQVPGAAHIALGDTTTNVTVRNNTIYFPSGASGTGIAVGIEGTGHVIANNSVYMTSGGTCFSTRLAAGAYTFVGNDACYNGTWDTTYDNTTHITANPLYTNPPTDFMPQTGSPLNGAGTATYSPSTDFYLKTRPSPPAIGAVEG